MDGPLLGGSKDAKVVKIDNFKYQQTFNKKKDKRKVIFGCRVVK